MEQLKFDSGVREYKLNGGGLLRFNPSDPNVYARFLEAARKLQEMEKTLAEQAKTMEDGASVVELLAQADKQMKELLSWVFGGSNDFDKLLGGVNLLAVAGNGERVVTNLFAALQPILVEGAERCAQDKVRGAVQKANARRAGQ